ncbi:MAG TPA: chaperone modulator CbpM [Pyrinomonadaceae bacterium]|nr:chaperone modulator CbpM [Pyrinomonadaceae bacterium]
MSMPDFDLDEPLSCAVVAESSGTRRSLVVRLARLGLLETLTDQIDESGEPFLPRRSVIRVRRMRRLHHDLGVNFTGAAVILDLVERITALDRELSELRGHVDDEMLE